MAYGLCTENQPVKMPEINETPLPSPDQGRPIFQPWHSFDPAHAQWIPTRSSLPGDPVQPVHEKDTSDLVLVTWNIDSGAERAKDRAAALITFITDIEPKVDIVFLQEVSRSALEQILSDDRVRQNWFSSEGGHSSWGTRSFSTATLVSKTRFASHCDPGKSNSSLGPAWRVKYPSRYARDALFCDIFLSSPDESTPSSPITPTRLVNVHLDSLPIKPSFRPQQISILSAFLSAAGRGLVAGDFNPVLEEDANLVEDNGLTDVWKSLRPQDPGYTWGVDGTKRFPPARLDKVAVLGLKPTNIRVLEPQVLEQPSSYIPSPEGFTSTDDVPWSDHHGLLCSFSQSLNDAN
ncbi:unnamed protein product [Penicillium salamii]|nr:unnamed protein product [Penicillium salamii]CAG8329602.1 unnamed protein product [Penicillium salamii]